MLYSELSWVCLRCEWWTDIMVDRRLSIRAPRSCFVESRIPTFEYGQITDCIYSIMFLHSYRPPLKILSSRDKILRRPRITIVWKLFGIVDRVLCEVSLGVSLDWSSCSIAWGVLIEFLCEVSLGVSLVGEALFSCSNSGWYLEFVYGGLLCFRTA
jgi:hypothetical protein